MSNKLFKSVLISPAVLAAALAVSGSAIAAQSEPSAPNDAVQADTAQAEVVVPVVSAEAPAAPAIVAQAAPEMITDTSSLDQVNRYSREGRAQMGQVTSVSQLSDVKPTDWAFQALQSLVERYGCIAGYPDKTYRGNRAMTRYEFAAGLNACMDRVNELIAAGTADLAKKEDLETLKKLQDEFAAELATLRGRVDALEARTATLEKQQFSTTTKLSGEAIFAVTDEFGQDGFDNNTVFQDRVRLSLNTSFTGKDLLVTRLAAGNANAFTTAFGGPEGTQQFNFGSTGNNNVQVDWLAYYGNLNDKVKFYIPVSGGLQYDYAPTLNPALDAFDGGNGPLSYFGQRNPIYAIGGGAGLGVNIKATDAIDVSVGYLANNSGGSLFANDPTSGLFNGSYGALAQVAYTGKSFGVGATYVHGFRDGDDIFGAGGAGAVGTDVANGVAGQTVVDAYGVSGYFKLGNGIVLNAFGSYVDADYIGIDEDGEIWTYGGGIAFPDLGKKGNLGGIIVGVQPYLGNARQVASSSGTLTAVGNKLPIHIEGFYKYQLTDNISVTPGVIWVQNPGQSSETDDIVIGTLRTTFTF